MTIEEIRINSSYLLYCKECFFLEIRPSDSESRKSKEYLNLVKIAKLYFENNLQDEFSSYLTEGQYIIQLWTAHLILEYGNPDLKLKENCLREIENYTENPLALELSIQEKKWLQNYKLNNK